MKMTAFSQYSNDTDTNFDISNEHFTVTTTDLLVSINPHALPTVLYVAVVIPTTINSCEIFLAIVILKFYN